MGKDPLLIAASLAVIVVVAILAIGIGGYAKGGEFNKKYGNKLMQARIAAQFFAVVLILVVIWLRKDGAS